MFLLLLHITMDADIDDFCSSTLPNRTTMRSTGSESSLTSLSVQIRKKPTAECTSPTAALFISLSASILRRLGFRFLKSVMLKHTEIMLLLRAGMEAKESRISQGGLHLKFSLPIFLTR